MAQTVSRARGSLVRCGSFGRCCTRSSHCTGPPDETERFGKTEWTVSLEGTFPGAMAVAKDGSVYVVGSVRQRQQITLIVKKFTPSGKLALNRAYPTTASKVIDPVEGVRWDGALGVWRQTIFAEPVGGELYVAAPYANRYQFGSSPRSAHTDVAVMAINAQNGRIRWAKQYRVGPIASPQADVSFELADFSVGKDGKIQVFGRCSGRGCVPDNSGWVVFGIESNGFAER